MLINYMYCTCTGSTAITVFFFFWGGCTNSFQLIPLQEKLTSVMEHVGQVKTLVGGVKSLSQHLLQRREKRVYTVQSCDTQVGVCRCRHTYQQDCSTILLHCDIPLPSQRHSPGTKPLLPSWGTTRSTTSLTTALTQWGRTGFNCNGQLSVPTLNRPELLQLFSGTRFLDKEHELV